MDWHKLFLETLHSSRSEWDDDPDWHAALALYDRLSEPEAAELDGAVLTMIDEEYRNPHSSHENLPFDDLMVNLPAGMVPDDLLCIEAAVLVAAERGLGEALFRFNRLMRSSRWHAFTPRLRWLGQAAFTAQRKLLATRAGRCLGALLGLAVGDALGVTVESMSREEIRRKYPEGLREIVGGGPFGLAPGEWSDATAMALAVARGIAGSPDDPVEAGARALGDRAGGNGVLMRTLPAALAYGADTAQAVRIACMNHPRPESDAAVAAYHRMVDRLLAGADKRTAFAAALEAAGPLRERLAALPGLTEAQVQATGSVVDTLEAAIWSFLTTESLEECIIRAVNLGDDTAAAGAVAGGLAGAHFGAVAVPRRWSAALPNRVQVDEAAESLCRLGR